jgi:GDP-mannose transporter
MSDKKNEDHAVRIVGSDARGFEKEPFLPSRLSRLSHRNPRRLLQPMSRLDNSPGLSILAYCFSSISMTVVNKFVVSGSDWNLYFFYLAVQVRCPVSTTRLPGNSS